MAAEHAPIRVQLVDDDEPQVLEEARPFRMVRQDPRVQHVRVGEDHLRAGADGSPGVLWRVAIVGEDAEVQAGRLVDDLRKPIELGQLVLRQRLGREQVEGAGGRLAEDGVEDRDVVAEGLARGRRRRHDHVAPGQRVLDGRRLVRVETRDAPRPHRGNQPGVDARREWRHAGVRRRHASDGGDDALRRVRVVLVPRGDEAVHRRLQRLLAAGARILGGAERPAVARRVGPRAVAGRQQVAVRRGVAVFSPGSGHGEGS